MKSQDNTCNKNSNSQPPISHFLNSKKSNFFHKSMYKTCKVIDVVDNSHILILQGDDIYGIDMHAASQKLLYMDSLNNISKIRKKKRVEKQGNKQKKYQIPNLYKLTLIQDMQCMNNLGWHYVIRSSNGSFTEVEIQVQPQVYGVNLSQDDFNYYLERIYEMENQQVNKPSKQSKIGVSQHEKQIIAEFACHNAHRFGDQLSIQQASKLIKRLGQIQAPFNCPHSRISITYLGKVNNFI